MQSTLSIPESCPCQSGLRYDLCCLPLHRGTPAGSPEQLMRSRYSANVLGLDRYLLDTWHESTRPYSASTANGPSWVGLRILVAKEQGATGKVHFQAIYRDRGEFGCLEEESNFVLEEGRWWYIDGVVKEYLLKPGRNERCPCGSGRKFKACCQK